MAITLISVRDLCPDLGLGFLDSCRQATCLHPTLNSIRQMGNCQGIGKTDTQDYAAGWVVAFHRHIATTP